MITMRNTIAQGGLTPSLPHSKQKLAPIFVLVD
jgi:hypothetical protein